MSLENNAKALVLDPANREGSLSVLVGRHSANAPQGANTPAVYTVGQLGEIDHFVMAITAAESIARHVAGYMPMIVLICGGPADGFQIVGSFADRRDAESYAEDHSLKDWWVARVISPEAFAESQRQRLRELRPAASRSEVSEAGSFPPKRLKR